MPTALRATHELSRAERRALYDLFADHFHGVREEVFFADLDEKPWVFVITDDADGRIAGFSTLAVLETTVDGRRIAALFSGDTALDERRWGDPAFARCMWQNLLRLAGQAGPGPVYWLLLTCTYRSYRFLPGLFREYYPRPGADPPADQLGLIEALVRLKFAGEYERRRGLVALREPTPFRAGRATIDPEHAVLPEVRYFVERNPNFARGDFLVCWAELSPENLTPLGRRLLG